MAGKQTPSMRAHPPKTLRTPHTTATRTTLLNQGTDADTADTEETRRSGRANKGQHTKNHDAIEEPSPAAPSKSKSQPKVDKKGQGKGQAKGNSVRAQSTQSLEAPEEEEAGEDIIRCVCGDQRDIRGRQMICCDNCAAWQHNKCLGLPEGDFWNEKNYFCEQCKPENHVELLAAMARGEKPWARKKGSKPKSRPSDIKQESMPQADTPRQSETPSQSAPAPVEASTPTPAPVQTQDATNGHAESKVRRILLTRLLEADVHHYRISRASRNHL